MHEALVAAGAVLAVVVAIRSTWSPCGLSMLSTVTPLAERGRGHRYGVTAAWFVVGGMLGGATLGAAAALLAGAVAAVDPSATTVGALVAIAAGIALASDVHLFGIRLPAHTRQVDEVWLRRFRPWVYGAGFGWQLGVGLATYIMTSGVYLLVAIAALTASPAAAFALAVLLGTVRGLAVLLGARVTAPIELFEFHRRFEAAGPYTRWAVIAVEGLLAFAATLWCAGTVLALLLAVATAGAWLVTTRVRGRTRVAIPSS
jgi:hypothetical protein